MGCRHSTPGSTSGSTDPSLAFEAAFTAVSSEFPEFDFSAHFGETEENLRLVAADFLSRKHFENIDQFFEPELDFQGLDNGIVNMEEFQNDFNRCPEWSLLHPDEHSARRWPFRWLCFFYLTTVPNVPAELIRQVLRRDTALRGSIPSIYQWLVYTKRQAIAPAVLRELFLHFDPCLMLYKQSDLDHPLFNDRPPLQYFLENNIHAELILDVLGKMKYDWSYIFGDVFHLFDKSELVPATFLSILQKYFEYRNEHMPIWEISERVLGHRSQLYFDGICPQYTEYMPILEIRERALDHRYFDGSCPTASVLFALAKFDKAANRRINRLTGCLEPFPNYARQCLWSECWWRSYFVKLRDQVLVPTSNGLHPFFCALRMGYSWRPVLRDIVEADPSVLATIDPVEKLPPFLVAACTVPSKHEFAAKESCCRFPMEKDLIHLDTIYHLLHASPSILQSLFQPGALGHGDATKSGTIE